MIDDGALAVVERWADVRRGLGISGRRRLFCTLAGGPLDASYVRQLLPRLAGRAGVDKRVHAHGLRHAHAVEHWSKTAWRCTTSATSSAPFVPGGHRPLPAPYRSRGSYRGAPPAGVEPVDRRGLVRWPAVDGRAPPGRTSDYLMPGRLRAAARRHRYSACSLARASNRSQFTPRRNQTSSVPRTKEKRNSGSVA